MAFLMVERLVVELVYAKAVNLAYLLAGLSVDMMGNSLGYAKEPERVGSKVHQLVGQMVATKDTQTVHWSVD